MPARVAKSGSPRRVTSRCWSVVVIAVRPTARQQLVPDGRRSRCPGPRRRATEECRDEAAHARRRLGVLPTPSRGCSRGRRCARRACSAFVIARRAARGSASHWSTRAAATMSKLAAERQRVDVDDVERQPGHAAVARRGPPVDHRRVDVDAERARPWRPHRPRRCPRVMAPVPQPTSSTGRARDATAPRAGGDPPRANRRRGSRARRRACAPGVRATSPAGSESPSATMNARVATTSTELRRAGRSAVRAARMRSSASARLERGQPKFSRDEPRAARAEQRRRSGRPCARSRKNVNGSAAGRRARLRQSSQAR